MAPMPLTISDTLMEQIKTCYEQPHVTLEQIMDFKQQARLVVAEDFGKAQVIYGLIAALEGNTSDVQSRYRQAVKTLMHDYICHHNFTTAFLYVHDYESAQRALHNAIETHQPDVVSNRFLDVCAFTLNLIERCMTLNKQLNQIDSAVNTRTNAAWQLLSRQPQRLHDFQQLLTIVLGKLQVLKISIANYSLRHNTEDGEDSISVFVELDRKNSEEAFQCQQDCEQALLDYWEHNQTIDFSNFAFIFYADRHLA